MVDSNVTNMVSVVNSNHTLCPQEQISSPQLGVIGFATTYAIEIYRTEMTPRPPRGFHIRQLYLKRRVCDPVTNEKRMQCCYDISFVSQMLYRYSIDRTVREKVKYALRCEARQLRLHENVQVLTAATPALDFILSEISSCVSRHGSCQTIDLSHALVEECLALDLRHIGIFGTPLDVCEDSFLRRGLHLAGKDVVPLPRELAHCVAFGINHGMRAGIALGGEFYDCVEEFYLHLVAQLRKNTQLDGMVICNPELHYVSLQLRALYPELKIVDAAEVHWKIINEYLESTKNPPT